MDNIVIQVLLISTIVMLIVLIFMAEIPEIPNEVFISETPRGQLATPDQIKRYLQRGGVSSPDGNYRYGVKPLHGTYGVLPFNCNYWYQP